MLIMMTMGLITMPKERLCSFLKHATRNSEMDDVLDSEEATMCDMWQKCARRIVSFLSVGASQFTYDFLRIWHLLIADISAKVFGGFCHLIHKTCVATIGQEWSPFLGFDAATNANVFSLSPIYHNFRLELRSQSVQESSMHERSTILPIVYQQ